MRVSILNVPFAGTVDFDMAVGEGSFRHDLGSLRSARVNTCAHCARAVTPRSPRRVVRVHICKKTDNNRRYRCAPRMFARSHGVLHTIEMGREKNGEKNGEVGSAREKERDRDNRDLSSARQREEKEKCAEG